MGHPHGRELSPDRSGLERLVTRRPGGVALFAPDFVRETFTPATTHGGHDGSGRAMRYLAWLWDPDPTDTTYVVDFAYLFHEDGQPTRSAYDRHLHALFGRADWVRLLEEGRLPSNDTSLRTLRAAERPGQRIPGAQARRVRRWLRLANDTRHRTEAAFRPLASYLPGPPGARTGGR